MSLELISTGVFVIAVAFAAYATGGFIAYCIPHWIGKGIGMLASFFGILFLSTLTIFGIMGILAPSTDDAQAMFLGFFGWGIISTLIGSIAGSFVHSSAPS